MGDQKLKILFLCTGNACRSQMAEGWTRHLKNDVIDVFSAGVETHGVDPKAVAVMKEAGLDISHHRSKHVKEFQDKQMDVVITVMSSPVDNDRKMTSMFERYLTVWVGLCIIGGILLGKIAPGLAGALDGMAITVNGAPVVSIPWQALLLSVGIHVALPLATVVGVLIEVPLMLMLVGFCKRTQHWFS